MLSDHALNNATCPEKSAAPHTPDVLLRCNAPFEDDDIKIQGSKWLGRQWWQSMRNLEYAMYLVHQANADHGGKHGAESLKMFKSIIQVLLLS